MTQQKSIIIFDGWQKSFEKIQHSTTIGIIIVSKRRGEKRY
jgi:hypothetical protein